MLTLNSIRLLRNQVIGNSHQIFQEIEKNETPFSIFHQDKTYHQMRELYAHSTDLKCQHIFSKVLKEVYPTNNQEIEALQGKLKKVQNLKELLNRQLTSETSKIYRDLPVDLQNYLSWAVWLNDSIDNKNIETNGTPSYGSDQIKANISVLNTAQKIIYLKGNNIVDQLCFKIEEDIAIAQQTHLVNILKEIQQLLSNNAVSKETIFSKMESLPQRVKAKIYNAIRSSLNLGIFASGKEAFQQNPRLLLNQEYSHSQLSIIQHIISEEETVLNHCDLAADINEFEKIAVLLPLANNQQKNELQKWLRPQVKEWIDALKPASAISLQSNSSHEKLYLSRGARYTNGSTKFSVFAPSARNVSVVLTAFGKQEHRIPMKRNDQGIWEVDTPIAQPSRTYLYRVEDSNGKITMRIDPFSYSTVYVRETHQVQSVVMDNSAYMWNDQAWMAKREATNPLQKPLSIYELQLKSWITSCDRPPNYREIAGKLVSYCKENGFNAVELYGILDHLDNHARGYQVSNFFSPYHRCGNLDDFKYFVDFLHANNIGVIIDWIPAHFQDYHRQGDYSISMHEFDGTNLFAAENSPWGTKYLDYSKPETFRLMFASALYWIEELHVDGIRVDAVSQLVRRNGNRIEAGIRFLQEVNQAIKTSYPGVLTIAEESEGFPNVTKPIEEGGLGFDLKWNIGWSHEMRNFLRTPVNERSHDQHWRGKVLKYLFESQYGDKTLLTHSHDDTDTGANSNWNPLLHCVSHEKNEDLKFASIRTFFALQALAPSWGHLIHMGDELVQNESWYQRFQRRETSVDWSISDQKHKGAQKCVAALNALYLKTPQLNEKGNQGFTLISENGPNGIVAYHRGTKENKRVAVIHNFSNRGYDSYDIPLNGHDPQTGKIQDVKSIFSTDNLEFGGFGTYGTTGVEVIRHHGYPTHLRLSLPKQSTLVLEETLQK